MHWKGRKLLIDLAAEKPIAAQRGNRKIAVEVKSFIGSNDLEDLYWALGQYILYRSALRREMPERTLFLALDSEAFNQHFADAEGEDFRQEEGINLLVFDKETEEVILWKQ